MEPVENAESLFSAVPKIECQTTRKGKWSEYFNPRDIASIREHKLDFILRFGFDIIRGDILNAAAYGVWSFHHGDERRYRGMPPGFWEIYHGDPVTGSVLQRLTDRLDGGVILKRGNFKTIPYSYSKNLDQALLESAHWPAQVCTDIRTGSAGYFDSSPSPSTAPIFRMPDNRQLIRFGLRVLANHIRQRLVNWLASENWSIGVVTEPIHRFLDENYRPKIHYIRGNGRAFLADPFGIKHGNRLRILCEEYGFIRKKGQLSEIILDDSLSVIEKRPSAITSPHHLSHPYLFTFSGETYCIPESFEAREIALYRASPALDSWKRVATLVRGVAAVDATVFEHEGRWWCTATDADSGDNRNLRLWYAETLFGPWHPHGQNMVKMDIRSARPAGTPFRFGNELYRPAQDCSRTYGGGILINRILKLTPTEFEEEPAAEIGPLRGTPFHDGVHTLSSVGDWTLIDGKRHGFVWRSFFARFLIALEGSSKQESRFRSGVILSN
jgi:hypothetical protein